jgi:hypothetical protein
LPALIVDLSLSFGIVDIEEVTIVDDCRCMVVLTIVCFVVVIPVPRSELARLRSFAGGPFVLSSGVS